MKRRKFLGGLAAGATGAYAGCLGDGDEDDSPPAQDGNDGNNRDLQETPEEFGTLQQQFEELESDRLENSFFLDSQVDPADGGTQYEGLGVRVGENLIFADRDIQDQEILLLEEDQEEFVWYPGSIPSVKDGISEVSEILGDEGLEEFEDEKLGDKDNLAGFTVLEDYMSSAIDDLEGIAPFVRLSENGEPIFSDDTIESVEEKYNEVKELKRDFKDLVFGPNTPGSAISLNQTVKEGNYTISAGRKTETLKDNGLQRIAGLGILEQVYDEAVDLLEKGQELAEDGEFDEDGESKEDEDDEDPETVEIYHDSDIADINSFLEIWTGEAVSVSEDLGELQNGLDDIEWFPSDPDEYGEGVRFNSDIFHATEEMLEEDGETFFDGESDTFEDEYGDDVEDYFDEVLGDDVSDTAIERLSGGLFNKFLQVRMLARDIDDQEGLQVGESFVDSNWVELEEAANNLENNEYEEAIEILFDVAEYSDNIDRWQEGLDDDGNDDYDTKEVTEEEYEDDYEHRDDVIRKDDADEVLEELEDAEEEFDELYEEASDKAVEVGGTLGVLKNSVEEIEGFEEYVEGPEEPVEDRQRFELDSNESSGPELYEFFESEEGEEVLEDISDRTGLSESNLTDRQAPEALRIKGIPDGTEFEVFYSDESGASTSYVLDVDDQTYDIAQSFDTN